MIFKNLKDYRIILASGSPRRQDLMKQLGLEFDVITRPVEEIFPEGMKGEEIAIYLSKLKADAFDESFFQESVLLITADTVVCLNDEVLGKPLDREDAINILTRLSGKMHKVITGISIRTANKKVNFVANTDVYFKQLSKEEIIYYVDNYKPFDKAGAYGIQEWIGYIGVEEIKGSFYNVMGLPIQKLYEELMKF